MIDGKVTQLLSAGDVGSKVVICFKDGRLCSHGSAAVFVTSPCFVEGTDSDYGRKVRFKFDWDNNLYVAKWGITDDHRAIFPLSPNPFISNLKKHKTMQLEFGCASYDKSVFVYRIDGLQVALDSAHLKYP